MTLPGQEAVNRIIENEVLFDTFLNLVGTYQTRLGVNVETIPSLMARLQQRYLMVVDKGNWSTGQYYVINDLVKSSGFVYICVEAHTSGNFATDYAANKWALFQDTQIENKLANYSNAAMGDALIAVKQPFTGAVARTQHEKNTERVSPEDFGAVGDGITDDTSAFVKAIDYCRPNKVLELNDKRYRIAGNLTWDYAPTIIGKGGKGYSNPPVSSAQVVHSGSVLVCEASSGYAMSISPSQFQYGLNLQNFAVVGKEGGSALNGLYLNNCGWDGSVVDVVIDNFLGSNLSIGYIQDTRFNRIALLRGGTTADNPMLKFTSNANYVYFTDCHIEDGNYLLSATGGSWEVHFSGCHFESGDYNGALGPSHQRPYASSPIIFNGNEYRWYFSRCTFVPMGVANLKTANGGSETNQPYYIDGTVSNFKFESCRWIASTTCFDAIRLLGAYGRNVMIGCSFEALNPLRNAVTMDDCAFETCAFAFYLGAGASSPWSTSTTFQGPVVNRGQISNCLFANNSGGATQTAGYLVFSSVDGGTGDGLSMCNNRYNLPTAPYKWVNSYVNVSSGDGSPGWYAITGTGSVDMERVPPGYGIKTDTGGFTITGMPNCQRGRKVKIFNNAGSLTVNFVGGSVLPTTANNLTCAAYSQYVFEADATGMLVQVL